MTTGTRAETFLDALANAIEAASAHNRQDQARPAAILWPDKDRQWESLLPLLKEWLPLLVLGDYSPVDHVGPAYWLRCIIAGTLPHPGFLPDRVPVLYLPGYSRQDLRALETCPTELQPLAELQYRGVVWSQKNGRDWTVNAFLQSNDGGLGIRIQADRGTREAIQRSLTRLAEEPIEAIRRAAPLRASYFDGLILPDNVKNVLRWLNDPKGYRYECSDQEWAAFMALCENEYDFHPDRDSPVTAAEKLGQQEGNWQEVWQRFSEAPASYSAIPQFLREAKPQMTLPLLEHSESWPQNNETAEAVLGDALRNLPDLDPNAAQREILQLEKLHGDRRRWVWSSLGSAPLAQAIEHLAIMAQVTSDMAWNASLTEIVRNYAKTGWAADLAVLDALACVEGSDDVKAVHSAVRAVYRPWLERVVELFQEAVAASGPDGYEATSPLEIENGACLLFVDGLRFDLAQRLGKILEQKDIDVEIEPRLAALPTVTATAKPAISPAAFALTGGEGFGTVIKENGSKINAQVLRRVVADKGLRTLGAEEFGDVAGRAWCESSNIDKYGHIHGWLVAHHVAAELRRVAERIAVLLDHGWQTVVVITDHGWLLMPGDLPKAELPEHLTESRKGRCARLKEGSQIDHQVVPWHWDHTVRIAMAPGIHCYEDGKEYEHGGLSPQECVVPILTATGRASHAVVSIGEVRWRRLRCNITVEGSAAGAHVDIRTKGGDASTTLAMGGKGLGAEGKVSLLVEDADREDEAALIVVVGPDGTVLAQTSTIIGGS
ncbi:MAG: BREX-1 system phosphatase PglZ type B [Caldilineaceae bacterium SB0665_bin_25]|nr:BREX-1 system phosphatase PglZ type B [Caldilineaceae bacterium SB0665_bin_25]